VPSVTDAGPGLVTLHLWRVPASRIGSALGRVAVDRFALRRQPGAGFSRLLGTGNGRTFRLRDAEPCRWGLLVAWRSAADAAAFEHTAVPRRWAALAEETWRAELRPLAARGRWSGQAPFGVPARSREWAARDWEGPVAALTRARLAWRRARAFWRAVPAVAADLAGRPGLLLALGIGERPFGLQGTFSVWESAAALRSFAYAGRAHAGAARQATRQQWYAEELFARFAVLGAAGTVDGRDPLRGPAW
jgi:hypothetical protein